MLYLRFIEPLPEPQANSHFEQAASNSEDHWNEDSRGFQEREYM